MWWNIRSPIKSCCTSGIPEGFGSRDYFLCEWSVKGSYVLCTTLKLSSGRRPPLSLPHIQPRKCFLYLTLPNPLSVFLPTLSSPEEERVVMRFLFFSAVTSYQCNCKWTVVTASDVERSGLLTREAVAVADLQVFHTLYTAQSNARMGHDIKRDTCKGGRNLIMQDRYVIVGSSAWLHICTTNEEIVPSDKNPT